MTHEPEPAASPRRANATEALTVGAILIGLVVAGVVWTTTGTGRDPVAGGRRIYSRYVGDKACLDCHPGESAQHSGSGHSRTLRRAADVPAALWIDGKSGEDPEHPGVRFDYRRTGDRLQAVMTTPEAGPQELLLQYALGSGHHANTFLTLKDGVSAEAGAIEHRLTVFAGSPEAKLGLTPGQVFESTVVPVVKTPRGRELSKAETIKCLDCHATVLSERGVAAVDAAKLIPNITCERCHGPAKDHVEAARRRDATVRMPFGSEPEPRSAEMGLCGHCHRLAEMAPPGAVRKDNPEIARFQPVGLSQSACFKGSNDALRCTTCHDPHARTSTRTADYEAKCLSCHSGPSRSVCSVSPKNGCVACHMPKRDAGQGILFTDHWIRIVEPRDERASR